MGVIIKIGRETICFSFILGRRLGGPYLAYQARLSARAQESSGPAMLRTARVIPVGIGDQLG